MVEKRTCVQCGKEFVTFRKKQRYCGVSCSVDARRLKADVKCEQCGSFFAIGSYVRKHRGGRFCSRTCFSAYKGRMVNVRCGFCKRWFTAEKYDVIKRGSGKFCSIECWTHFRRERRFSAICMFCGNEFFPRASSGAKYCNQACFGKHRTRAACKAHTKRTWNGKGVKVRIGNYPSGQTQYRYEHSLIAEKVLERRMNPGELVHHINGDNMDNRNCNLLICDTKFHSWLHSKMCSLYQKEHFANV